VSTRREIRLERFGAPELMQWVDGPMPTRDPQSIAVAVEAIGVNFADTMVRRGEYRRDQPLSFTPGFEVCGRVIEGPATGPPPGTRVVVFTENGGGYADAVVAGPDRVYTVMDGVPPEIAAGIFTQGVSAWYSVHRFGRVTDAEAVLVHAAAGGLGGLTVQLCAELGARVIATASTRAKLEIAAAHGADVGLLSEPDRLTAAVRAETGGRGADVVIDGVGGPLFEPSLRALAFNGRYVVAGAASQQPATVDVRALMPRGQTIVGFVVARVADDDAAEPQRAFDEIQRRWLQGRLRPQIDVRDADEVVAVHRAIEARELTGKVVLTF
jgi:NADPH2:quinone reductase